MVLKRSVLALAAVAFLGSMGGACRGGSGQIADGGGGSGGGMISNATELKCPYPGTLPFKLESSGFQNADNASFATDNPRSKDESSDTLGNEGGKIAQTYLPNDKTPAPGPIDYRGRKARTGQASGLTATPLPGEFVSLWFYDVAAAKWNTLGRTQTDVDGFYDLPSTNFLAPLGAPVYAVMEADGSCGEHYDYLMPSGTKFIITDIDGTMTFSDDELFKQIDDGAYVPLQNTSADALMNAWSKKGYEIVYLTARPHLFRAETRRWLADLGFPTGSVITANSLVFGDSAREYKGAWVKRMTNDFGWDVVAAYGNAESDIQAYEDAGIPKGITFIVGEFAGASGTVAVPNNDFSQHITDFVNQQPDNP